MRRLKELEVGIKVGMLHLEIKIKVIKGNKILWNIIGVLLECRISHLVKSQGSLNGRCRCQLCFEGNKLSK